jgi:plastocyanin
MRKAPKSRHVHVPAIARLESGDKVRWVNDRSREQEGTFVKRSAVNPAEAIIRPADGGQWLTVQVGRLERVR